MPTRSASALDAIKAFRNVGRPGFTWAIARAAADWDFGNPVSVPAVHIEALVAERPDIVLHVVPATCAETTLQDLVAISSLVRAARPTTPFAFGTFTGLGTLHLALNAPGATVHTLDLEPAAREALADDLFWERGIDDDSIGSLYRTDPVVAANVVEHWGDSRAFDTTALTSSSSTRSTPASL